MMKFISAVVAAILGLLVVGALAGLRGAVRAGQQGETLQRMKYGLEPNSNYQPVRLKNVTG